VLLASLALAAATASARPVARKERDLVLYEVHTSTDRDGADTIVTYVTPERVRVSQATGDAILDMTRDRLVFLDRAARTFRTTPLSTWESHLEASVDSSRARSQASNGGPSPGVGFEPMGPAGRIAHLEADRYHLFTRRELFPGEVDLVEQEVCVAHQFEFPEGAYRTYLRTLEAMEGVGLAGPARRPPGLVLRVETRTHPADAKRGGGDQFERTEVVRVERRHLQPRLFEIPAGFTRADSADALPTGDGAKGAVGDSSRGRP
jgi:hypothetical protein